MVHFDQVFSYWKSSRFHEGILKVSRFDGLRRLMGFRILHCLGDSHVAVFAALAEQRYLRKTVFRCVSISGATAMGMVNPNSGTNALRILRERLALISCEDYILLMLGEVDCGFVIWYRASKYKLSVESQFEFSLSNYRRFVASIMNQGYRKIIICSAPLPTILDGQTWGEIANARRDVNAGILERTKLTQQYNSRLWEICDSMGISYLDLEAETLDSQTQLIRCEYRNRDPLDHHLNPMTVTPLLAARLRKLGFS